MHLHIKMIKCIIFDLDGTLINTLNDLAITTNEILKEYGYKEISINKCRSFIGNGIRKLLERSIDYVGGNIELLDEIMEKFLIEYNNKCLRFASVYSGINELLNLLKEKNYLLFVNTNKMHNIALKMINNMLPNIFNDIYGDSSNYPRKPDPYIVNKIKKDYHLNNDEIIYIGDSNVDVLTAHNASIKVIGCAYGFGGEKKLFAAKPDYLIHNPLEILEIIN